MIPAVEFNLPLLDLAMTSLQAIPHFYTSLTTCRQSTASLVYDVEIFGERIR